MKANTNARFLLKVAGAAIATATLTTSLPALAHHCGSADRKEMAEVVAKKKPNIVEVAVANGSFNTLVAAVKAAGLVDTLSGKGPFTVFAPTDAAFAKLPEGTVEKLLKPENKAALVKVLTYHVVPSKVFAKDIKVGSASVKTVEGGTIAVTKKGKSVTINNANVAIADVKASNGVIHVIDTVLLPPDLK
jgi:uncharacterized surface protein with fasciclin (FAS1) repeats